MPKTKNPKEYPYNVKPPKNLWEAIQKLIDEKSNLFYYRTPTEFIIESARIRLMEIEKQIQKKEFGKR